MKDIRQLRSRLLPRMRPTWCLSPAEWQAEAPSAAPDALIAAVRAQLGLKLSLERGSLPVLNVEQARGD